MYFSCFFIFYFLVDTIYRILYIYHLNIYFYEQFWEILFTKPLVFVMVT